ncbi:hypothetical protein HMPREF3228_00755, partial [Streptococcus mitis]
LFINPLQLTKSQKRKDKMCPFSILAFLKLTTVYKELTYVHNLTDNFNFLITTQAMKYFA